MSTLKVHETIKELNERASDLFERLKKAQNEAANTYQAAKRVEKDWRDLTMRQQREQEEAEAAARLRELIMSDSEELPEVPMTVPDFIELPLDALGEPVIPPEPQETEKAEAVAAPEKRDEEPKASAAAAPPQQPETEKPAQTVKASETPSEAPPEANRPQIQERPAEAPRFEQRAPREPRPQGQQSGFAPRPQGQQNGYAPRPQGQQGGYAPRPQGQQGGYSPRPQGQQGGYAPRPQGQQSGYAPRPQGQQGGYAPRPQGQGGYAPRPQGQQGAQRPGFAPRPQGQGGFAPRPQAGGFSPRPQGGARPGPSGAASGGGKEKVSNYDPNRSNYSRSYEADRKTKNRKAQLKEAAPSLSAAWDDERTNRRRPKKQQIISRPEPIKIEKAVITTEVITVKALSEKIGKPAAEIIKKLFLIGTLATINQEIDFDTCALIAQDYGIELEFKPEKTFEDVLQESAADTEEETGEMVSRPPVVTIMGHVDHGKTSLLDAIRDSRVVSGEAGGITQHIGAYTVDMNGRSITFIDTPGHEAFTSMRARGAQVTDIAILVVAADDGVMPQTIEAINHAKAAGVPIIVAINKIDKADADPDRIKQQLTEYELVSEEWGGDTICVPVSATTHQGLDTLMEMIILVADMRELKANPNRMARGTIIEAQLDKGRGPVATVLVQNGTLKVGDTVVAGTAYGRIRAMMTDKGERVETAGPSQPVEVLGFSEVPDAGDQLNAVEVDRLSRQVAEERRDKIKAAQIKQSAKVTLDDLFQKISEGNLKDLNLIVKADVQGSVEAVKQALEKVSNEEVRVRVIHGAVGAITEADVMLAGTANAIIIGFNVRPNASARAVADKEKIDVRLYRVIYQAIEDVEKAIKGMLAPEFKDVDIGHVEVRQIFKVSSIGTIAGCYVQDGKITRSSKIRVVRDGTVIHDGLLDSLKRFKDDAKEVAAGYECGVGLANFNDIKEGDIFEAYITEEVKR